MQRISIDHAGQVINIEYATDPHEITLRQWVDATLCLEDAPENVRELLTGKLESTASWGMVEWSEYYTVLAEFVSIFCVGSHDIMQLIPKGGLLGDDSQNGIGAMFSLLVNAISNYKPQDRAEFEHKGVTYRLPLRVLDAVGNVHHAPELTTIEAIEALQIEHVYAAKKDGKFIIKDRRYPTDLGIAACICRKVMEDGTLESMPLDMNVRRRWVTKKMQVFGDLPMSVALDIAFFLANSKRNLLQIALRAGHLQTKFATLQTLKERQVVQRGGKRLDGTRHLGK